MNFRKEVSIQDSQLESASQQKVASLIKAMPEEELSLSWRSSLNVKLLEAQQAKAKRKQIKRFYAWGSSLSVGVAASVFALVMFQTPTAPRQDVKVASSGLASELVKAHQESMVLVSVSGTGAAARETSIEEDPYYYPQDDLL
jgi:hypothetical protein